MGQLARQHLFEGSTAFFSKLEVPPRALSSSKYKARWTNEQAAPGSARLPFFSGAFLLDHFKLSILPERWRHVSISSCVLPPEPLAETCFFRGTLLRIARACACAVVVVLSLAQTRERVFSTDEGG